MVDVDLISHLIDHKLAANITDGRKDMNYDTKNFILSCFLSSLGDIGAILIGNDITKMGHSA